MGYWAIDITAPLAITPTLHYSNSPFEITIEGFYETPSREVKESNLFLLAFSHLLQLRIQQGHYLVGRDGEGRSGV
jgi:hypothetical protein